jgi:hypothetical protein
MSALTDPTKFETVVAETYTPHKMDPEKYRLVEPFIVATRALHADAEEREGRVAMLEVAIKKHEKLNDSEYLPKSDMELYTTLFTSPSTWLAERLTEARAEGAAEALAKVPCTCRTIGTTSEDATTITCERCSGLAEARRAGGGE